MGGVCVCEWGVGVSTAVCVGCLCGGLCGGTWVQLGCVRVFVWSECIRVVLGYLRGVSVSGVCEGICVG